MKAAEYKALLYSLMPQGKIWKRRKSSFVDRVFNVLSSEFELIDIRVQDLFRETDPNTTSELIPEWEKELGLPEKNMPIADTQLERISRIVAKYLATGGLSKQFYIDLIAGLGFTIEINEFAPFEADVSLVDDGLFNDDDWRFTWEVNIKEPVIFEFLADMGCAEEPIGIYKNDIVSSVIEKLKPSHTQVIFTFDE